MPYGLAEEGAAASPAFTQEEAYATGGEQEGPDGGERPRKRRRKRGKGGAAEATMGKRERPRQGQAPREKVPAAPLVSGVFTFPFYPTAMRAWVWLSAGGTVLGFGVVMLRLLWPF